MHLHTLACERPLRMAWVGIFQVKTIRALWHKNRIYSLAILAKSHFRSSNTSKVKAVECIAAYTTLQNGLEHFKRHFSQLALSKCICIYALCTMHMQSVGDATYSSIDIVVAQPKELSTIDTRLIYNLQTKKNTFSLSRWCVFDEFFGEMWENCATLEIVCNVFVFKFSKFDLYFA